MKILDQIKSRTWGSKRRIAKVRWPIRYKITIPYLLLSVLIALGAYLLVRLIVLETVDERYNNQLYEGGVLAASAMVSIENRQLDTLRLLTYTQGVAEAIQQADADRLQALALGIAINNQVGSVEFLDDDGDFILGIRQGEELNSQEYLIEREGASDYQNWPFVQAVLSGRSDEKGDKFAGTVNSGWGQYFYVAGPIRNTSNQLVGTILIGVSLERVTREIREATLAQITLYDFAGNPIASSFPDDVEVPVLEGSLAQAILENQESDSFRRSPPQRALSSSGLNYAEIIGPWEARGGEDLGLMGTALAKNVLVNASLPSLVRIGGLILSAIALIVLIGFTLSALITRPLTSLMHASEAVTDGDLSVKVTRQTNDEIGVLAESFNKMVLSLNQSHQRMVETYDKTLEGWAKALELKDKETSGHTLRVTELTVALARRLNLPEDQIEHIRRGAMLHDIGKMGIPDQILLKPGPLDEKEWKQMRDHPAYAHEMLKDIPFLEPALEIPYCHHERWDGKGYPRQLKGDQIPLPARLFAIVDAWDALTSNRPYHQGLDDEKALQEIQAGAGSQFDPNLVAVFCEFVQTRQ